MGLHQPSNIWAYVYVDLFKYCMRVISPLTADGEERVGLLSLHTGHTFQSGEPSPADIHPTLHLCLPKHGTE